MDDPSEMDDDGNRSVTTVYFNWKYPKDKETVHIPPPPPPPPRQRIRGIQPNPMKYNQFSSLLFSSSLFSSLFACCCCYCCCNDCMEIRWIADLQCLRSNVSLSSTIGITSAKETAFRVKIHLNVTVYLISYPPNFVLNRKTHQLELSCPCFYFVADAAVATVYLHRWCCWSTIRRNSNTGVMMNWAEGSAVAGIAAMII